METDNFQVGRIFRVDFGREKVLENLLVGTEFLDHFSPIMKIL